ncbi:GNAT family N-acetyltransferase [Paludibacterium purpuratum]|uniref:RimJ/RimL family protein N-acetyltransferase n=1 Tax=Paludibacterium purpuratum TaxID=1144873 RepID=A0A4V3DUL1_9NEIS|nr:GNAT family N-acetyltransferase [Paludibacterium purpuratum]TDR73820.1 RimJ/RimL family protein N-acetyltransferase [Paludibacterium purpuratum]
MFHTSARRYAETSRLILRAWQSSDLAAFRALNGDALVMAHFPAKLAPQQSDALAERLQQRIVEQGWGFWALERKHSGEFIGFCGLNRPQWQAAFTPCVEIGWRLARPYWRQGYAREAARAALALGFTQLALAEIVAFTVPGNVRSLAVMQAIGMRRDIDGDFLHPQLPPEHPLARHVLYRLAAGDWRAQTSSS